LYNQQTAGSYLVIEEADHAELGQTLSGVKIWHLAVAENKLM
jgi:hypothetical protein